MACRRRGRSKSRVLEGRQGLHHVLTGPLLEVAAVFGFRSKNTWKACRTLQSRIKPSSRARLSRHGHLLPPGGSLVSPPHAMQGAVPPALSCRTDLRTAARVGRAFRSKCPRSASSTVH